MPDIDIQAIMEAIDAYPTKQLAPELWQRILAMNEESWEILSRCLENLRMNEHLQISFTDEMFRVASNDDDDWATLWQ